MFLLLAVLLPGTGDRDDPVPAQRRGKVDVGAGSVGTARPEGQRPHCCDDPEQDHGAHGHSRERTGRSHQGRTGPVRGRHACHGRHRDPDR
jgi:hypothetical protein